MKMRFVWLFAAAILTSAGSAPAAPVAVEVVLETQESIRFDFADGTKHFVLAVRREGVAEGTGPFAGATIAEIGWHDVNPPNWGSPQGYLQVTAPNGDVAVLRWKVTAIFTKPEGKLSLRNHGIWELTGGTGQFERMRGVGALTILPLGGPNKFTLTGELGPAP
ncbi:MAG: hypothetical protein D6754_00110 [Alphaproteobacteria bacterium]|nr:MAG: hypothetical protein D6754_00110 [Alphaproteobacteria bacterium]